MNYGGNMPDWHQYNPPPSQPNINEGTSSNVQNVNSPHHYSFVPNVASTSLNGHNPTSESLEKAHQNDAGYGARHYQAHGNIPNGQNAADTAILPSMVQMPGCVGHYGPANARNSMGEHHLNGPVDSRNVPIAAINDEMTYRNNQLPLTGPIPHLMNGPNVNINSAAGSIGPRNNVGGGGAGSCSTSSSSSSSNSNGSGSGSASSNTVPTVRQGPPSSYIPCKGICCNPLDPNVGYQHWEKFGPYQHHTSFRENARPTGYQTENRWYGADFNFRKDNFDGKETMAPGVVPGMDHKRNFPEYKYRKDPIVPRNYPPTSASLQNYSIQNYSYNAAEYQKYSYSMKEYPKVNGMTMPSAGILKHQEQNLVTHQKYNSKPLQYQNVGYLPKGSNISPNIMSPTQASYYNSQFPRTVQPSEFPPRECQEQPDNSAAINRMQPTPMQNAYSRYQAYQQKIMMQRATMENHLREMSRIPGYQSHSKYKESILRYRDILKAQQSMSYQNPVQPNSQANMPINGAVPPINLQFDQNGTLINTNYLPEVFPQRMQQVLNAADTSTGCVESLHDRQTEHALNMSKAENREVRSAQHLANHSQTELRPNPMCPKNLPTRDPFHVPEDLRQVPSNEVSSYEAMGVNLVEESAVHQKISKEFADKPELDVRQFLANWDETEDEDPSNTTSNLPAVVLTDSTPVVVVGYENIGVTAKSSAAADNPKQKDVCTAELNADGSGKKISVLEAQDCLTISYPSSENIEISKFCSEESAVGSVVKPGSIIHCISNGPDEMPTIHIVDNVEIGNILKVSTEPTNETTFIRQNSLPLFEEPAKADKTSEVTNNGAAKKTRSTDSSGDYDGRTAERVNPATASSSSTVKNDSPKAQRANQTVAALSKNDVDPAEGNLRKQSNFLCEETHNPDDISLPDLPTSECTPISTTLNTPVHSDNEETADQVEDLTISTNPIEVVQNSPIISFTHSPVNVEPYEHLNRQRSSKSHEPLEFDFPEDEDKSSEPKDTVASQKVSQKASEKADERANRKANGSDTAQQPQKIYMLAESSTNSSKRGKDVKNIIDAKTNNKVEVTSAESAFQDTTEAKEKLRPVSLEEDSLYNGEELSERDLIDTAEMIPLIPGDESEEPRMPVPPMEGNCLTKVMKDTLPITNLNVIGSDDEKLEKEDDIWMQVGCIDRLIDCSINLENAENSNRGKSMDASKFSKIPKKHHRHCKRIESNIHDLNSNDSQRKERDSITIANSDVEKRMTNSSGCSDRPSKMKKFNDDYEVSDGKGSSKSCDPPAKSHSPDNGKDRIKVLKEYRKMKSKPCSSMKSSDGNSDAISKSLRVIEETQKICRTGSPTSFTKSFIRKNSNPDFEIQVTNVNLKIKDKDIRTELRTLKEKNEISTKNSLDAIKIEINVSRGERTCADKHQSENSSEEVDLSISNNKTCHAGLEYPTGEKKSIDKLGFADCRISTKSTAQDDRSKDRKIKFNNPDPLDSSSLASKRSKTEQNSLKITKSPDCDTDNAYIANKVNLSKMDIGRSEDEHDSFSIMSNAHFEKDRKNRDLSDLLTETTTNDAVRRNDGKETLSGKEDSLVISNKKFLFDAQKQSDANYREDVSDAIGNLAKPPEDSSKIVRIVQDENSSLLTSESHMKKSESLTNRPTDRIDGKRASFSSTTNDFLSSSATEENSKTISNVSSPLRAISGNVEKASNDNKTSTLSNLSEDIKKLQDQFDSIEAAGKNFCLRDMKKLQEQLDSIEAAEKSFCGLEVGRLYSVDSLSENPRQENTVELDFNNFDVAPNEASDDSDDTEAEKWKKPKSTFRFDECDLYESSSGFINPIFTSLDELENLNTVPVYTTKDGKITYSPNKRYTYRALIVEARERERYSASRDSKARRLSNNRHSASENSRKRHMEYDSSRTLQESSVGKHFSDIGAFDTYRSRSREDHVELFRNKDDPKFEARFSEDKCPEENRKFVSSFKRPDVKESTSDDRSELGVKQLRGKLGGDDGKKTMIIDTFLPNKNVRYDDGAELTQAHASLSERKTEAEKSNSDRLSSYIQKFGAPCESIKTWNVEDVLKMQKSTRLGLEKNTDRVASPSSSVVKEPPSLNAAQNNIVEKRSRDDGNFSALDDSVNSNGAVVGRKKEVTEGEPIHRSECSPKAWDLNMKSSLPEDRSRRTNAHSHVNEPVVDARSTETISVPFCTPTEETPENIIQSDSNHEQTISLQMQEFESQKLINIDKDLDLDKETEAFNNRVEVKSAENVDRQLKIDRDERRTAEQSKCQRPSEAKSTSLLAEDPTLEMETARKTVEIGPIAPLNSKSIQRRENNKRDCNEQTAKVIPDRAVEYSDERHEITTVDVPSDVTEDDRNIREFMDEDLELPTLVSNLESDKSNEVLSNDPVNESSMDDVPPVLQEEPPLVKVPSQSEAGAQLRKATEREIANRTSSTGQITKADTEGEEFPSNCVESLIEEKGCPAKNGTIHQTIPKLIIKKTESSLDGTFDSARAKLKVSSHRKIPKMIIRNVRSRPTTPVIEEISTVKSDKTEQMIFKVDSKPYGEFHEKEDNSQQSKTYDSKILKVKIKLDENSPMKSSKGEAKEIWASRKDSKKMVPKVTITKIKTSPKIQDNNDQFVREAGSTKSTAMEANIGLANDEDKQRGREQPGKIPKLKLKKQESRPSSPDVVSRKRQSFGGTEISSKKFRKSGREVTKQCGKRNVAESSEKQSLLGVSEKVPKVIIKRTSASAEFKCELSKEGKDAIIKNARWQPAVKLQRSEMLDRMVMELKNSRVTLTQAILRVEEGRYRCKSRLSRSNSTSNLPTPAKSKERRMSDYDHRTNYSDVGYLSTFAKTYRHGDGIDGIPRYIPKYCTNVSQELIESGSIGSFKRQSLEENLLDVTVNADNKNVPKRRDSGIARQEEINEETQDACQVAATVKSSQMELVKSNFNTGCKVMCIIPEANLEKSENFDSLESKALHFDIKQESACSFKDEEEIGTKRTEDALTRDQVEEKDCTMEIENVPQRAGGVVSMDSFEDMETSVIKVDSSDESQTTIEMLAASPDVSQDDTELRSYGLSDNVCERLYSEDAIPTQFELELEITDNSNVDPLDVPLPKDTHFYRNEVACHEDDERCFSQAKLSKCVDVNPRGKSSRDESFVDSHAPKPQTENNVKDRLSNSSFWCSDSLVKEVLAAKETLKKCLTRFHGENKAGSKIKPKTAAEKKQGYSFSIDNLTDCFKGFAEFAKSGEETRLQEDLRVGSTNKKRKTDIESDSEKSDRRHSPTEKRKNYEISDEGRSPSADNFPANRKNAALIANAPASTTISLKNSKRLGHAAVLENDEAASSCRNCEQTKSRQVSPNRKDSHIRCPSDTVADLPNKSKPPSNDGSGIESKKSRAVDEEVADSEEKAKEDNMPVLEPETPVNFDPSSDRDASRSPPVITNLDGSDDRFEDSKNSEKVASAVDEKVVVDLVSKYVNRKERGEMSVTDIVTQLAFHEKATINHRRYCILCERWFPTTARHRRHLTGYQHRHTELVQRRTIHALFMFFTGRPCPRLLPANVARTDCSPGEPTPLQIAVQDVAIRADQPQRNPRKQNNVNK